MKYRFDPEKVILGTGNSSKVNDTPPKKEYRYVGGCDPTDDIVNIQIYDTYQMRYVYKTRTRRKTWKEAFDFAVKGYKGNILITDELLNKWK